MNKKVAKLLSVLAIVVVLLSVTTSAFALTPKDMQGKDGVTGTQEITDAGNAVIGILQTVGIVLSVVILIVLGIKYMMGSAEEKSEYKKTFIPYIVGAGLIFAASIFANVIFQFFSGMGK